MNRVHIIYDENNNKREIETRNYLIYFLKFAGIIVSAGHERTNFVFYPFEINEKVNKNIFKNYDASIIITNYKYQDTPLGQNVIEEKLEPNESAFQFVEKILLDLNSKGVLIADELNELKKMLEIYEKDQVFKLLNKCEFPFPSKVNFTEVFSHLCEANTQKENMPYQYHNRWGQLFIIYHYCNWQNQLGDNLSFYQGDFLEQMELFKKNANEIWKKQADYLIGLFKWNIVSHKENAINLFISSLKYDSKYYNPDIIMTLARCYQQKKITETSRLIHQIAVTVNPFDYHSWYGLGVDFYKDGELKQCYYSFDNVLKILNYPLVAKSLSPNEIRALIFTLYQISLKFSKRFKGLLYQNFAIKLNLVEQSIENSRWLCETNEEFLLLQKKLYELTPFYELYTVMNNNKAYGTIKENDYTKKLELITHLKKFNNE